MIGRPGLIRYFRPKLDVVYPEDSITRSPFSSTALPDVLDNRMPAQQDRHEVS